jgi:hypothetical protein
MWVPLINCLLFTDVVSHSYLRQSTQLWCKVISVEALANMSVCWNASGFTSLRMEELQPLNRFSWSLIIESLAEILYACLSGESRTIIGEIRRKQNVWAGCFYG